MVTGYNRSSYIQTLQSWSAISIGSSKLKDNLTEAGKKVSEAASQKLGEVSRTMSEKVLFYKKIFRF